MGNIGSWGAGATPSRSNKEYYQDGTIPWLKTGDLNDGDIYSVPEHITEKALQETSVQLNPVGSVLIAMYGATIGKVGVLQIAATTNQACCACSVFNGVDNRYLFLFLLSQKENFKILGGGGAQPNISKDKIINYLFPLPPREEQQQIVEQIKKLLGYVDIIDTDAETLEKSITLAKQKILDLAIRGKLVPQDPTDEPASELLKKIKAEKEALVKAGKIKKDKHESFIFKGDDNCYYEQLDGKTTDITDEIPFGLPDNWAWCRLREIGNILYGVSESAKTNGCYKLLRITDIQNDSVNWQTVPFTDFSGNAATYFLRDGDIVFARTGATVGKSFLIESAPQNAIYASYLIRVRFIFATVAKFIKNFFGSSVYWEQIVAKSVGTGQPNVNGTSLSDLFLPIPPLAEQKRIVSQVEKLFAVLETMRG